MRLITYSTTTTNGTKPRAMTRPVPGLWREDGSVIAVHAALDDVPSTVAGILAAPPESAQALRDLAAKIDLDPERAAKEGLLIPADQIVLHEPLGERVMLVCAGANYRSHLAEMNEQPPPRAPWFVKSPNAVIGSGQPITLPPGHAGHVDFEGELCVVFGRYCHKVSAETAMSYVAGYTLLNDVSARDALPAVAAASTPVEGRWAWTDMLLGKQFPTFAPLGPAIVTVDDVPDPAALRLTTTLNGTVMQDASLSDLLVAIPELVEQLSRYFAFAPGDVLSTGTPAGVGVSRTPQVFLRPGDTVCVRSEPIGSLTNEVAVSPSAKEDDSDD